MFVVILVFLVCLCVWLHLQHMEVLRPGIKTCATAVTMMNFFFDEIFFYYSMNFITFIVVHYHLQRWILNPLNYQGAPGWDTFFPHYLKQNYLFLLKHS